MLARLLLPLPVTRTRPDPRLRTATLDQIQQAAGRNYLVEQID